MKISDKDIKDILHQNMESPSYGFTAKTMRLIQQREKQSEIYAPLKLSMWVPVSIVAVIVLCAVYAFGIESAALNIDLTIFYFSPFWMWSLAFSVMALGLWTWIFLSLKGKVES